MRHSDLIPMSNEIYDLEDKVRRLNSVLHEAQLTIQTLQHQHSEMEHELLPQRARIAALEGALGNIEQMMVLSGNPLTAKEIRALLEPKP